jgi:FtsP/CotA-like multicopper oxidase with cupredoxin domain
VLYGYNAITPNLPNLRYNLINNVKYFEIIAELVKRELLSGDIMVLPTTPGPTIQVYPGDYVNIRIYNKLPEETSVH